MKTIVFRLAAVAVAFTSIPAVASAALMFSFEPGVSVARPSSGTTSFTIDVLATASGADALNSYAFPFNVGPAGLDDPPGISFGFPVASPGPEASIFFDSFSPAAGADGAATDLFAGISFDDGDVKTLFTINLVADSTAQPGTVAMTFDQDNAGFTVNTASGTTSFTSGSFEVTAIPEPGSLGMLAIASIGGVIAIRRRKGRQAASEPSA